VSNKLQVVLGCLCVLPGAVSGVESQPLEQIREAVGAYLVSILHRDYRDFDVKVAALDPRLRLPKCSKPLAVAAMRKNPPVGNVSLRVRCEGEHPWTIYAKARVSLFKQVLVMARPLPKGARLTADAVTLKRVDVSALRRGYVERAEGIVGRYLRRRLAQGDVLTPDLLAAAKVIRKGESVTIRAVSQVLEVRMGGHALMDGEMGQRIRVRNDRSNRVVEAVVSGPGEVRVLF